jgi:hypothetical protein
MVMDKSKISSEGKNEQSSVHFAVQDLHPEAKHGTVKLGVGPFS